MAYILVVLCKYPQGSSVDRAWVVLNAVFSDSSKEDRAGTNDVTGTRKEKTRSILWQRLLKLLERAQCVRNQALQAVRDVNYSSDAPPALDLGCVTSRLIPSEKNFQPLYQNDTTADPFLGFKLDFGEEVDLDEMEAWIQSVQNDFNFQQNSMDDQRIQFSTR